VKTAVDERFRGTGGWALARGNAAVRPWLDWPSRFCMVAALLTSLVMALFQPAVAGAQGRAEGAARGEAAILNATVDEILDEPAEFIGQTVVVNGEAGDALGARGFTIEDSDALFDDDLLVLSNRPLRMLDAWPGANALDEQVVAARGEIRWFDLEAFEDELGVDLDDGLFDGWDGKPVLMASFVDLAPRISNVSIDDILDEPEHFIGQPVVVDGEVDDVLGLRAFTVEDGDLFFDDDILVVGAMPVAALPGWNGYDASEVRVAGTVRWFDLEAFEDELGVDLDDALFDGWDGRPVIMASAVNTFTPLAP
jgi:hypothetical protein